MSARRQPAASAAAFRRSRARRRATASGCSRISRVQDGNARALRASCDASAATMSVFSRGARRKHRRRTPRFLRPVLRPMAFRVLPRELRPTRVWRLAEALALGVRDPEFEVLLRRIDAAPLHRGNAVTVFFDGPPRSRRCARPSRPPRARSSSRPTSSRTTRPDGYSSKPSRRPPGAASPCVFSPTRSARATRERSSGVRWRSGTSRCTSITRSFPSSGISRTAITGRSSWRIGAWPSREA